MLAERHCTMDIPQDSLEHGEMWHVWIVHMQAGLLHRKCKVRSCHGQVHERAGQASVGGGIIDRCTIGGEFAFGVNRCMSWLTIMHDSMLQDVLGAPRTDRSHQQCASR